MIQPKITIIEGQDDFIAIAYNDSNGALVDLTDPGYSAKMDFKENYDTNVLLSLDSVTAEQIEFGNFDDAVYPYNIKVNVSAEDSLKLNRKDGFCDLKVTKDDVNTRVFKAIFVVDRQITI